MNRKNCYYHVALMLSTVVLTGLFGDTSFAVVTGQYPLDANANDTSGFGRNGTVEGGATFGGGLYMGSSGALVQTTAGQSVTLPPSSDFIRNAPGATLMAWVRPDTISGTHSILVVNNGNAASTTGIGDARAIIQINANTFRALGRFGDADSSVNVTGGAPVIGQSYFVTGVFDYLNSGLRLYVNGQQVGTASPATWISNSADTANLAARIGSNANGTTETFLGAIDGARIFNSALTATEILNLYNAETFPPPLAGDTDGNGIVEPADLTPIRTNWRKTGQTRMQGNLSGDTGGLVDFADFRQWKTAMVGAGASFDGLDLSFANVPEPSTVLLLVGCAGCFGYRPLRRRSGSQK
jgi:hypothetical protein